MGNTPERARAKETLWRLMALALAHPAPEFHAALARGAYHAGFADAWGKLTGRAWPDPGHAPDFEAFEAGFISAFLHGRSGKPVAALLAGDHENVLAGLTRPVFMLNLIQIYKHFGLAAASADEGHQDEPDHLASMTEFMAVLCHLEARALERGRDPSPYRRAERDFLSRFLAPSLESVAGLLRRTPVADLDPTVLQVVQDMAAWSRTQITELEAIVGPYRDPDAPAAQARQAEPAAQNLWG
ncbi:MAG: molecular chaperone TorD family protein [Pseudomonadota bacterium]